MFRSLFSLLQTANGARTTSATDDTPLSPMPTVDEAERAIEEALREMNSVITRLEATKANAQAERNEASAMLQSYKSSYADLASQARSHVQAGRNDAAREALAEQQSLETVIASFERITGNMTATVQKLASQIDSMRIQREELKARRTVLAAELASALSREEFLAKLRQSGASHELLERETIHAELRLSTGDSAQAESEMREFHGASADAALKALEHQIEQEFAAERAEKERLQNEISLKRFQTAFALAEKASAAASKHQTHPAKSSEQAGSGAPAQKSSDKQSMIDNFFGEQKPKTSTTPAFPSPSAEKKSGETNEERINNFFLRNPS
jgi:phage shock protein A